MRLTMVRSPLTGSRAIGISAVWNVTDIWNDCSTLTPLLVSEFASDSNSGGSIFKYHGKVCEFSRTITALRLQVGFSIGASLTVVGFKLNIFSLEFSNKARRQDNTGSSDAVTLRGNCALGSLTGCWNATSFSLFCSTY